MCQGDGLGAGADIELPEQIPHMELDRILADGQCRRDGAVAFSGNEVLEYFELPRSKVPSRDIPGQAGGGVQGKRHEDVCTPARHDVDLQVSRERLHPALQADDAWCIGGERTAAVVSYVDEQVLPIAIPLRPDPGDVGLFHHDQKESANDSPRCVGNFTGQVPSIERRLDELDLKAAEACERPQVLPEALEGCGDRFFHQVIRAVAEGAELDQGLGGKVDGR